MKDENYLLKEIIVFLSLEKTITPEDCKAFFKRVIVDGYYKSYLDDYDKKDHNDDEVNRHYIMVTDYDCLNIFMNSKEGEDFFKAPASTKYHGADECGLFRHSLRVLQCYLMLEGSTVFDNDVRLTTSFNLPAILFHDACKINFYKEKQTFKYDTNIPKQKFDYNPDYTGIQHGPQSVIWLLEHGFILDDTWKNAVAYHMGAFVESDINGYGKACEKFPEVLMLHTADMMASKIYKD